MTSKQIVALFNKRFFLIKFNSLQIIRKIRVWSLCTKSSIPIAECVQKYATKCICNNDGQQIVVG